MLLRALLFAVLSMTWLAAAEAEKRVALVIGNAAYASDRLTNPVRDADLIAQSLKEAGFDTVTPAHNADRADMLRLLDEFHDQAMGADIAVVYFSGHGMEMNGTTYLIPVDATLSSDTRVKYEAIALDDVMNATEGAKRLKLVIFDACRDNRFAQTMKRVATKGPITKGAGRTEPNSSNMLIAYATAPGKVANDGDGANSPFATALARQITKPGVDVEKMLRVVRDEVIEATRASRYPQEPFKTGSIGAEDVYLNAKATPGAKADAAIGPTGTDALRDFETARAIKSIAVWDAFLAKYPDGFFAVAAADERRRLIAALNSQGTMPAGQPPEVAAQRPPEAPKDAGANTSSKGYKLPEGAKAGLQLGHSGGVTSVAFSPDGRQALSGSGDKTLKLWDVAAGREVRSFSGHSGSVYSVVFSPDGRQALSGSSDKTLKLWDVATGREIRSFKGHSNDVWSVAFSPDGRQALSGSWDYSLKLWNVETGTEIRNFKGHLSPVVSVTFSPDGRSALSGSWDNTIRLWNIATGREVRRISGNAYPVSSVMFSPDGKQALLESGDNTLKIWDSTVGNEIRSFGWHSDWIMSVAFSPDGKSALSGSYDKTIRLWDVVTGGEIRRFLGHSDWVLSVAFSPDGRKVLSGSADKTLKLWDVTTGALLATFASDADGNFLSLAPDGRFVTNDDPKRWLKLTLDGKELPMDDYIAAYRRDSLAEVATAGK